MVNSCNPLITSGVLTLPSFPRGENWSKPEVREFLDETRDLRKELHLKRFEYIEALRNPDTSKETLTKLRLDMKKPKIQLFGKTLSEYGW